MIEMNEYTNPLQEFHLTEQEEDCMVKHAHKFTVKGIYDWTKPIKEEMFDIMRIFCHETDIGFSIRSFHPEVLSEDRTEITQLPAYHIYIENQYVATCVSVEQAIKLIKKLVMQEEKDYCCVKADDWISRKLPTLSHLFQKKSVLASKVSPY
jgi:hypothetical protein